MHATNAIKLANNIDNNYNNYNMKRFRERHIRLIIVDMTSLFELMGVGWHSAKRCRIRVQLTLAFVQRVIEIRSYQVIEILRLAKCGK